MSLSSTHDSYEAYFCKQLAELGFCAESLTYHDHFEDKTRKIIQRRYSSTALYVRTRSDRIAIHNNYPYEFLFEVKTRRPRDKYPNWAIELFPLFVHKIEAETFGARCLYVYYDPTLGIEAAFWSNHIPKVDRILIPIGRWNEGQVEWYEKIARRAFPSIKTERKRGKIYGSGDPFVIINLSTVETLPRWESLISKDLEFYQRSKENGLHHKHMGGNVYGLSFK